MMDQFQKYIVLRSPEGDPLEVAIVFDKALTHARVASSFPRNLIISAGMCDFAVEDGVTTVACWGTSVSLGLTSRGEPDARLIFTMLNGTETEWRPQMT